MAQLQSDTLIANTVRFLVFRILVIGKTGVDQSSLINHVFGADETAENTIIARDKPGEASIDHEFISPQNDRFIDHRRDMSPQHQLHAVWLCFQIPRASAHLLETGAEEFLTLKRDGTLGNTTNSYKNSQRTKQKPRYSSVYQYPDGFMRASEMETLAHLIQITENCVGQHSTPEAVMMTSIARRVHPILKIKALIKAGKKRYRQALVSCPTFKNRKIQVFSAMMMNMVDKIDVGPTADPTKTA
ncbi:uncharacterized protein F5147DRAFT_763408 [Suillus discolor]|uniref:G domain-containing protein n=1 Tax=Suillus discolor TaxID=1912936 RepID=A0A9P7JQ06_9AGAM|nr:uncharacterized protein F5147DRAFT_763408 [Suillus discolor]KAG2097246.1 hypothetical protein F5147DRAFT_763408 [Suillus discolor]